MTEKTDLFSTADPPPVPLESLVDSVNDWCNQHKVRPLSGQSNPHLTVRTARFYRARGLLDPPEFSTSGGYSKRHFLQLCAIRILQAQGLPLDRIQTLLYGRPDDELQKILDSFDPSENPRSTSLFDPTLAEPESWQALPLGDNAILILRNGARLTPAQREALHALFAQSSPPAPRNGLPKKSGTLT